MTFDTRNASTTENSVSNAVSRSLHDECHGRVFPEKVTLLQPVKQFAVVAQPKYSFRPVRVPFLKLLRNPKFT